MDLIGWAGNFQGNAGTMLLKTKEVKKSKRNLEKCLDKKSESGTISFVESYASALPGRFASWGCDFAFLSIAELPGKSITSL